MAAETTRPPRLALLEGDIFLQILIRDIAKRSARVSRIRCALQLPHIDAGDRPIPERLKKQKLSAIDQAAKMVEIWQRCVRLDALHMRYARIQIGGPDELFAIQNEQTISRAPLRASAAQEAARRKIGRVVGTNRDTGFEGFDAACQEGIRAYRRRHPEVHDEDKGLERMVRAVWDALPDEQKAFGEKHLRPTNAEKMRFKDEEDQRTSAFLRHLKRVGLISGIVP